jgi:hypothetical protein
MCAGALVHARVARVVYGAPEPRAGALGSSIDVYANAGLNHRPEVVGGVLDADCSALVKAFFRARREAGRDAGLGPRLGQCDRAIMALQWAQVIGASPSDPTLDLLA